MRLPRSRGSRLVLTIRLSLLFAADGLHRLHLLLEDLARQLLVIAFQDQLRQPLAVRIIVAAAEDQLVHLFASDVHPERLQLEVGGLQLLLRVVKDQAQLVLRLLWRLHAALAQRWLGDLGLRE